MIPSLETRWFLRMEPPERPSIFSNALKPSTRTDWYARAQASCGIKFREGNFELKLLLRKLGARDVGGTRGHVEEWRKWIFEVNSDVAPTEADLQSTQWVAIQKNRSQLIFSVTDGALQEVTQPPANGCRFEWTALTVDQEQWLTIGFEAFGHATELEANLTQTARHVLPHLPGELRLDKESSYSYPEWLNRWITSR